MHTDFPVISLEEGQGIESKVVELLKAGNLMITTAESCTGGLISARLVNVSGASEVFGRSFVTYANEAKVEELGVKKKTLEKYGAVSKQTVKQMAKGALLHGKADLAVAVTGLAGPDGGTPKKPVGTGYIGVSCRKKGKASVYWQKYHFTGNRSEIREQTAVNALYLVKQMIERMDEHHI